MRILNKTMLLLPLLAIGGPAAEKRRLEDVTWNPVTHELRWVISKGEAKDGSYNSASRQEYRININDATMSVADETRRFSQREADSVRQLLDVLSRYSVESTIWWEQGQGEPVRKGVPVLLPAAPPNPPGTTAIATSTRK